MPTIPTYNYVLDREDSIRRGIQTLRGSHEVTPIAPVEVGHDHQFLMDWRVVDDMNGCYRTVHQPAKHPDNPILQPEHPYEATSITSFGTVLREPDTGRFLLWTPVSDQALSKREGKTPASKRGHYYESDDGLHWRRPELGLFEYDGSKANNIFVQSCTDNLWVLALPERMRDRGRYAMLYCSILPNEALENPERGHGNRNFIAFSEDGVHWKDAPENPVWSGRTDCGNNIVYNGDRDVFMMYRRATINAGEVRRIAYSESKDLITWTQPVNVVRREENDPIYLYSMHVTAYHGIYLGQLLRLHVHPHRETCKLGNSKDNTMDTELAWSRDGIHWERHPDKPDFIPTSPPFYGAYDWGMAMGMGNIIEMDDHIRVYYGGRECLHSPGYKVPDHPTRATICLGTLRPEGFVSVDANEDGGYMLTRPLNYPGGRLHVNAKTAADGFVRVAVREGRGVRDGEWQEGWRFDDSIPFTGDSLDAALVWKGAETLDAFPGKVLRLHFWMEKAELYSFWFGD